MQVFDSIRNFRGQTGSGQSEQLKNIPNEINDLRGNLTYPSESGIILFETEIRRIFCQIELIW